MRILPLSFHFFTRMHLFSPDSHKEYLGCDFHIGNNTEVSIDKILRYNTVKNHLHYLHTKEFQHYEFTDHMYQILQDEIGYNTIKPYNSFNDDSWDFDIE